MRVIIVCVVLVAIIGGCKSKEDEQKEREALKAELKSELAVEQADAVKAAAVAAANAKAEEEAAKEAARKAAKEAARKDVLDNPGKYLVVKNLSSFDKGILNSYRSVSAITVLNSSKYPVDGMVANVEWFAANGAALGSTPLTLTGSIAAGDTKTFSGQGGTLRSGTLQGAGKTWKVRWSHVELVAAGNHD